MGIVSYIFLISILVLAPTGLGFFGYQLFRLIKPKSKASKSTNYFFGGVIGALSIIGLVSIFTSAYSLYRNGDKSNIDRSYTEMRERIVRGDLERAYEKMTEEYRNTHDLSEFKSFASTIEPITMDRSIDFRKNAVWFYSDGLELFTASIGHEMVRNEEFDWEWEFTGNYEVLLD